MTQKKHDLTPATDIFVAYAVYADYDGNAPDSTNVILLATQELAEQVLQEITTKHNSLCFVDGWEWSKSWRVRPAYAPAREIATTFADAKEMLGDEDEQDEEED